MFVTIGPWPTQPSIRMVPEAHLGRLLIEIPYAGAASIINTKTRGALVGVVTAEQEGTTVFTFGRAELDESFVSWEGGHSHGDGQVEEDHTWVFEYRTESREGRLIQGTITLIRYTSVGQVHWELEVMPLVRLGQERAFFQIPLTGFNPFAGEPEPEGPRVSRFERELEEV